MCWMSSKWAKWYDPNSWSSICVCVQYIWFIWMDSRKMVDGSSSCPTWIKINLSARQIFGNEIEFDDRQTVKVGMRVRDVYSLQCCTSYSVYIHVSIRCTRSVLILLVSILMLKFNIPCTGYVRIFLRFIQKFHLFGAPVTTFIHTYILKLNIGYACIVRLHFFRLWHWIYYLLLRFPHHKFFPQSSFSVTN